MESFIEFIRNVLYKLLTCALSALSPTTSAQLSSTSLHSHINTSSSSNTANHTIPLKSSLLRHRPFSTDTRWSNLNMPRNVEIKASVHDVDSLNAKVFQLTDSLGQTLVQEDTFFTVTNGRLKLRVIDNQKDGQLIYYDRADKEGPKLSTYHICPVTDTEALKLTLSCSVGVRAVVRKVRQLYMFGQTRIHIDQVDALGTFMELEVCLRDDQSLEDGQRIAQSIMSTLGVPSSALQQAAYVDLLAAKQD